MLEKQCGQFIYGPQRNGSPSQPLRSVNKNPHRTKNSWCLRNKEEEERAHLTDAIASLCPILVYNELTFPVAKILDGEHEMVSKMCIMCFVSFKKAGVFSTNG